MKTALKNYINKLFSYIPVAVFVFTLLMFINITSTIDELKVEYGANAIDEFIDLYLYYFYRTIILALLIPLYDKVLSSKKFSFKIAMMIHGLLIISSVGILQYRPDIDLLTMVLSLLSGAVIYIIIVIIIFAREKQFLKEANEIFKANKE